MAYTARGWPRKRYSRTYYVCRGQWPLRPSRSRSLEPGGTHVDEAYAPRETGTDIFSGEESEPILAAC